MNNLICMDGTVEIAEELKNKYNPEGSTLRKAQLRMLDMVLYIDKICKENNLQYHIEGGNLLGAVRHNGFIPWDDDFDIALYRRDYKKLIKILKKTESNYVLQNHSTDFGFVRDWSVLRDTKSKYIKDEVVHNARKYQGVQVDIFPFSYNVIKPFRRFITLFILFNEKYFVGRHKILSEIFYIIPHYLLIPLFHFFSIFNFKKEVAFDYGAIFTQSFQIDKVYPYKTIEFEGAKLSCPNDIDYYLKMEYGDNYLKLPNRNDRDHHKVDDIEFFE